MPPRKFTVPLPDNGVVATTIPPNRTQLVRRGQRLEYFTIAYNSLEGLVSIVAGAIAGSVSLIGFGLDSIIEVTSGAALLWRLHHDLDHSRREQVERTTLRIVGGCFIALAAYIALRIRLHADRPRSPGAEHPRHHHRRRLGGRDAVAGESANAGLLPGSGAGPCKPIPGRRTSARKTDFCTYHGRDGGAQLSAELLGVFATVELLPSELRSVGRMQNARYHFNEFRRHKRLLNEGPPVIQHK